MVKQGKSKRRTPKRRTPKRSKSKRSKPKRSVPKRGEFPSQYLKNLSRKDKKKQLRSLRKLRSAYDKGIYIDRPQLRSYKNRESGWTAKFHKLYPEAKTVTEVAKAVKIPVKALREVIKKGKGAYYSSGSRPNQTADSWGKARMYAYILGSPTRRVDHHITQKYKVTFIHKPNFYPYQSI